MPALEAAVRNTRKHISDSGKGWFVAATDLSFCFIDEH